MNLGMRMTGYATRVVPRRLALRVRESKTFGRLARSAVNAVVPAELQTVEVAGGPLLGARMRLDLKREKGFWAGTFEPWVQDTLVERLGFDGCAWDVGAYVGYHTLLLHRLAGPDHVVALEPDPDLRARLLENLDLNDARGVHVIPAAAAAVDGTLTLQRHLDPIQNSVDKPGTCGTVTVDAVRLDSLLADHPAPTVVKMDIEGGEVAALEGAEKLLHDIRPLWLMELHWQPGAAALDCFEAAGYEWRPIDRDDDVRAELLAGGTRHVVVEPR